MTTKRCCCTFAVLACILGLSGSAHAEKVHTVAPTNDASGVAESSEPAALPGQKPVEPLPSSKISFAPMPVDMYLQQGQKPIVAVTMPCIEMGKAFQAFPLFTTFENLMFQMIGNMNDSEMLPMKFEPVCI
ncbi:MAG: hypothetical protein ACLPXB_04195 [Thiobacillaceae bacterium]